MPKLVKVNSPFTDSNGTCLQGHLSATYQSLLLKFGEPSDSYDDYKSDAEWHLEFEDGTVATIYNWKDGKNYCGDEGLELSEITEWHIGGRSPCVEDWINDYVNNSWPAFDEIRQQAQAQEMQWKKYAKIHMFM